MSRIYRASIYSVRYENFFLFSQEHQIILDTGRVISLLDLNAELFEDFLYYFIYQSVLEYFIYQMWKLSLVSYMKLKINFIRRYYYYFRLVLLLIP